MKTYIRMMIVLSVITLLSGLALGGLNQLTYEQAENNILKFKKIPAVTYIYEAVHGRISTEQKVSLEQMLLTEKKYIDVGEKEPVLMFVIKKNDKPFAVSFERFGQGFGGSLGVMAGFELENQRLVGIGITTMAETPGVGTRVKEAVFLNQFKGLKLDTIFKVKKDGGQIDAVTGATISSRAVANALDQAQAFYAKNLAQIKEALQK